MNPLVLLAGAGSAFLLVITLAWSTQVIYDKRARLQRVRTATGKRQGRIVTQAGLKPQKNTQLQQGALSFMKASTRGLSIMKGRQVDEKRGCSSPAASARATPSSSTPSSSWSRRWCSSPPPRSTSSAPTRSARASALDAAAVVGAALLGAMLPDLVLKNMRQKRLESIRKALPDSLDMLVICAEAGLSSDASLKRVVAETSRKSSVLGEELNQTALELSFMPERRQALENLAERAPLPSVNAFCNTMIQAEKYGTPLARAFKVLSQEQRNERMLRAEEKAGRLPATMTVPMMIFILPALFIVLIGPAVLDILDNFINMNK